MMTRRAPKTAAKTAKSPLNGAVIPLGAHPGNTGGKPGRSGRPRKAFKDFLADLRQNPKVQQAIQEAAEDAGAKNFKAALDVMVRYDIDVPAEKVDHLHTVTDEERETRVLEIVSAARERQRRGEMVS